MRQIDVVTIFPEMFEPYLGSSIIGKARERGLVAVNVHNLRDHTEDKHRTTDDTPYGGGPGMVMKIEPIARAFESIKNDGLPTRSILVTPQGRRFDQGMAEEFSKDERRLLILCGRYEGVDERVVEQYIDDEVSVGDYVLTGGELPALVIIDASVRLLPGVLGDEGSLEDESFSWGILDYPQYTRPPQWGGKGVPEVLTSGNHAGIDRYRRKEALRRTMARRPDLLDKARLDSNDMRLIEEIKEEE
ncbi:MAG: tRNA (guanosine(37)-N1)-methyltransferase TrmD [Thermodesulfovibrionales bacterium]|nr:tRNA (guanosine(37)-N1)-methyltransferase TrmD [Thermodesulfovibrionales bacterium]